MDFWVKISWWVNAPSALSGVRPLHHEPDVMVSKTIGDNDMPCHASSLKSPQNAICEVAEGRAASQSTS